MTAAKKATLYIDIDDEITTIIDKTVNCKEKIVALVLPKRATVLQSIVNMKLLKRSADDAKKKIVLITSEPAITPLAGIAGVHIAKTLQSKPEVPKAPIHKEEASEAADDVEIDATKPVGQLAGDDVEETAQVPEIKAEDSPKNKKSTGKLGKIKIPNFSKFRLRLILAVAILILLIGGWVFAAKILPKAEVVVKTDTRTFNKELSLQAAEDSSGDVLPAKIEMIEKSGSETVQATGQKNVGDKAKGKMTITNCVHGEEVDVPVGTQFTKGGKSFVTTELAELEEGFAPNGDCLTADIPNYDGQATVNVIAVEGGSSYNINEGSHNSSIAGLEAYGSDMKDGTDDIRRVVSQGDIDKATDKLKESASEGLVEELEAKLASQGYIPFESTFESEEIKVNANKKADDEAEAVTVEGTATYRMAGVLRTAVEDKIREASQEDIDNSAQAISDTGIDDATIRASKNDNGYAIAVDTTVTVGPQLDPEVLKNEILGKKYGETENILSEKAGVVDVDVDYSPFWVNATPGDANKVTVTVENIAEINE